jgi:fatty acid-binding protein DegV
MKKILFVTDSCADLPYNFKGDNVMVVPFRYSYIGETDTLRDTRYKGKNNNTRRDTHLIKSMGVSYCEVLNVLNYATDNDMDVIVLYSSGRIDEFNRQAFEMATTDFKANNMGLRVTVIDSLNISQGLGLLFEKVVDLYEKERSYDEIVTYIVQNLDKYRFDIETDDIDYYNNKDRMSFFNRLKLVNGGESSLLTLKEGKVVVARRCDDIALRRDILVSRFVNDADLDQKACIVYNDNDSWEADMLKDLLVKSVDQDVNIDLVESSIVSGSVIRPYSLGLAYKIKEK